MYDAIIIGAGPAGLQAALTLGRMHRTALLLDSGDYRNGRVLHMHNMIGEDGTPPAELRARARVELAAYRTIETRDVAASAVSGEEDAFRVTLDDGTVIDARRVVLATGLADDLPDIPGLRELWGRGAFSCPFCDGHEHAGAPIAVIGPAARAEHLLRMLGPIASTIALFPVDGFTDEERRMLTSLGGIVRPAPVESVRRDGDTVLISSSGETTAVAGIFVASASARQRAPFAEQLALRMLPSGAIEIDDFGRTSAPGVVAAGDLAHRATQPGPLASVLVAAAAGQLAATAIVQSLIATP